MALLATLVIFLLANTVPGDPVLAQLGDLAGSNKEFVAEWGAKWGLDLPLWERYLIFLQRVLHGDLGISIASQRPVLQDIRDFAPATLELASIAFLLALIIGIPLGIMAAVRRDSWIDHVARLLSLIGVSSPTFWLAFIMLALFYGGLQIAPGPGRIDAIALPPPSVTGLYLIDSAVAGDWDTFRDAFAHLILPSIVLAAATLGLITRTTRASMLESMQQDYVRVARAKGLRERRIVIGHILPNALIPVVTLGRLAYANLLTGARMAPALSAYLPVPADVTARLRPPSWDHWLGTGVLGRDVFTRLIHGARISLTTGIIVVLVAAVIGTLVGGIAAYVRGRLEELIMRLTDLVLCFPPIILAMAIAAALGIGTTNTIIAMLVVWWPKFARLARSLVLVQRSQEYVEAAVVMGLSPARILMRHIMPNSVGPLIVLVTLDVGNAIITFAGLSFLGLGVIPPTPEWGSMVSEGRELIEQWWAAAFPGLAILTVVLGFNFLGDGIRDWLDPRSRRR